MSRTYPVDGRAYSVDGRALTRTTGPLTVDDYERTALDYYDGDTADYAIIDESTVSFDAPSGTRMLELSDASTPTIYSTTGLPNYPSKGQRWQFQIRNPSDSQSHLFALDGTADNGFVLRWRSDNFRLLDLESGSTSYLTDADLSLNQDTWYTVTLTWDDGSFGIGDNAIQAEIDGTTIESTGLPDKSGTDGIGFEVSFPGQFGYIDNIRITEGI